MTHLSSEQMSAWILGECSPEVENHLQVCVECHQETHQLQQGLLSFKRSMREWAEQQSQATTLRLSPPRVSWRWAAVAVLGTGFALLPLYLDLRHAQVDTDRTRDSLLLSQVNDHLARSVPRSMEPLFELMSEEEEGAQ